MMEELVMRLAELQAELDKETIKADFASADIDKHIADTGARLMNLKKERDISRQPHTECAEELQTMIDSLHEQIIDEWTGSKKTMVFDAGTLTFTSRGSLKIHDPLYLMVDLLRHYTAWEVAEKYIKGFNLTAVKKYMGVHDLPPDVAAIEYKTTVKLEQKSG